MDMDLDIKIDPDLLQIRLTSAHRYSNSIQIHFKPTQIRSDWIWIMWILGQIQSIAIPNSQWLLKLQNNFKSKVVGKCQQRNDWLQ